MIEDNLIIMRVKDNRFKYFFMISYIVVGILVFRILLFDIGQVSSDSMSKTIKKGKWIVINKISYGVSFPIIGIEMPWLSYFSTAVEKELWKYWRRKKRIFSTSSIQRGDIVMFRLPTNTKIPVIKRIVGLPGETFSITFQNQKKNETPFDSIFMQNKYYFYHDTLCDKNTHLIIKTAQKDIVNHLRYYSATNNIDSIFSKYYIQYGWSPNNFGPLFIPQKGSILNLNDSTLTLYKQELTLYEGNEIIKMDSTFICNGQQINKYTFKYDYYFGLGDNILNSYDSRYYGLIPSYLVIGKVL